jgi:glycerophosphoryl diester phosphodiesterase
VRRFDGSIETGLIYARHDNPVAAALRLQSQYLVARSRFVGAKDIADARARNLKVIVWTVNTRAEAKRCRDKGVDGIVSDRPDIL